MQPLEKIYGPRFFARRHRLNWRAPIVCKAIRDVLAPKSIIDVGCATGDLVAEFVIQGVQAFGIEGSTACLQHLECSASRLFLFDIRYPLPKGIGRYDLALCLEVAEHIEPEYAHQLIQNLGLLSGRILISAAPPGQGGHYHVNCRPPEYWVELFCIHAFKRVQCIERQIKQAWEPLRKKPGIKAYYENSMYFERKAYDRDHDDGYKASAGH